MAWKSWVDENPTRAKNFAAAVEESFRSLRQPENFDAAVQKYGQLAGVTTPAAIATYKKLLAQKGIFLAHWDKRVADAQWQFLQVAKEHGILDSVPAQDGHALLLENEKPNG